MVKTFLFFPSQPPRNDALDLIHLVQKHLDSQEYLSVWKLQYLI